MNRSLLIAAGLAAALITLAAWWFWLRPVRVASVDDGRPVAEAFLTQIRAGQIDAAWESTTAEFKSDEGREQFRQYVAQFPVLRQPLEFAEYQSTSLNGLPRGQCCFRASATPARVRVVLAREADTWKADGLFVE
jgi:hypothetical protein